MAKAPKRLNYNSTSLVIKWASRVNIWTYKATGGRLGGKWRGGSTGFTAPPPIGILTTIGRKSGEPRESPLVFLREGERVVFAASYAGRADNPMWYLNLKANPAVSFRIKNVVLTLSARDATEDERSEYWAKLDALNPDYEHYRSFTERKIPIVICDPA